MVAQLFAAVSKSSSGGESSCSTQRLCSDMFMSSAFSYHEKTSYAESFAEDVPLAFSQGGDVQGNNILLCTAGRKGFSGNHNSDQETMRVRCVQLIYISNTCRHSEGEHVTGRYISFATSALPYCLALQIVSILQLNFKMHQIIGIWFSMDAIHSKFVIFAIWCINYTATRAYTIAIFKCIHYYIVS